MARPLAPARGERGKLGVLLACVLVASVALLVVQRPWLGLGGGEGEAAARPCWARAPEVVGIPLEDLARLGARVADTVPAGVGREYEEGYVSTSELWSDNDPVNGGSKGESAAGGYEQRWWALDRHGGEDDVVADVWEFSTPQRARDALALALDPSCRGRDLHAPNAGASAPGGVSAPPGAHDISWTNPDNAREWDSLLLRGRLLYRVADVPAPGHASGEADSLAEATKRTVNALACRLPQAGCRDTSAALTDSSLATGVHTTIGPGARGTPTRAQAASFARAVNLESYDVPDFSAAGHEARSREGAGAEDCEGRVARAEVLASVKSPTYLFKRRARYERVASVVNVLASEALAAREVSLLGSARARGCAEGRLRMWLAGFARRDSLRTGAVHVQALRPELPRSYRGNWAYRATALRVRFAIEVPRQARRTAVSYSPTAQGGIVVPIYAEEVTIAYGRALITLTTFSIARPYCRESERYLESVLLARAEAWEG